ncbi:chemotaxis protein CheW [uncultured Paludibaculum sp.]|uniref:chemotaxis protein CheW n=1 Tax=uncultured Paludibaculum sp. TaxID=1765020 RepID=UPI002AAC1E84|nr:chemotaxis protein CheW [uncultured Paludibaculum sp.]
MAGGERFLVVRLAGREFAVPSNRVRGMLRTRGVELHRVEGRCALRYLIDLHGKKVPVYVPHHSLRLKEIGISARSCLLLISDNGEVGYALAVDSISREVELPAAAVRASAGLVRLGDKWRTVLDLEALRAA